MKQLILCILTVSVVAAQYGGAAAPAADAGSSYGSNNYGQDLPTVEASHEFLEPRHHKHHHHHHGHHHHNDNDCKKIKLSCSDLPSGFDSSDCSDAKIKYRHHREKAEVSCPDGNRLITGDNDIIFNGIGNDVTVKCRKGRWTVKDENDERIHFKKLRCLSTL